VEILRRDTVLFDRFRILQYVTAGGQSFAYKAQDLHAPASKPWTQHVFVKQYHDISPSSQEAHALKGHFERLNTRLTRWANRICLPLRVDEAFGSVISIFPWINDRTLDEELNSGIAPQDAARYAFALVSTLTRLHRESVAHLDLKPKNVVFTRRRADSPGYITLVDFDAAQIDGTGLRAYALGTEYFNSPEHSHQSRLGAPSARSDVFSLGILLCLLLFGEHPYCHTTTSYADAIENGLYSLKSSGYHFEVVSMIEQCLRPLPLERPSSQALLSIFNKHHHSMLRVRDPSEEWVRTPSRQWAVHLTSLETDRPFKRHYYHSVELDSTQMRGSRIQLHTSLARIECGYDSCWIVIMDDSLGVLINGRPLHNGDWIRLESTQQVQIASTRFALEASKMN